MIAPADLSNLVCSPALAVAVLVSMVEQQREEIRFLRALLAEVSATAGVVEARYLPVEARQ